MLNKRTSALIIWWCEGTKLRKDKRWKNAFNYSVEVINSDPRIVKIFADYLREDLLVDISKLKGQIQIHEGDELEAIEKFWSEYLNLPREQITKTIVRKEGNRKRNNFGTFKIRLYSKKVYEQLQSQLDEILSEFDLSNKIVKIS